MMEGRPISGRSLTGRFERTADYLRCDDLLIFEKDPLFLSLVYWLGLFLGIPLIDNVNSNADDVIDNHIVISIMCTKESKLH